MLDMHICIPCVNRRGPHNWHSSNPAAVILLVCGRCTDPASSQWLVCGTARPIPGISRFGATTSRIGFPNKANLPQTSGIYGSHHRCAFFIASVSAKSNEEDSTAVIRRGDHIGSLHGKNHGRTSAKQQFHNEKRMPFHLAIRIRSMPSATFHRGWRK